MRFKVPNLHPSPPSDLAQYSRKTHKSVMTAAHGIVNLVRYAEHRVERERVCACLFMCEIWN